MATLAFLALVASCVLAMYGLRVAPRNAREWRYLAIVLAFLAWVLPLMTSLRSR